MEGMAFGKAVIGTAVGGTREMIQDGKNGFLVPPADSGVLAERIEFFLDQPETMRQMGKAARETILKEYLIEDKMKQLEGIICDLVNHQGKPA
jgi:glycosyltransferase involved in cell wall biosynthesis